MWKRGRHDISLSAGRCHVHIDGPAGGPPVLLIHGATVPGWEFERIIPWLTDAGFRVVCPDLYGHGESDRPNVSYGTALFTRQLEDLLCALSFDQRVHLIGHSLGCVVAANLVIRNARYYGNLACVAPLLDFVHERSAMRIFEKSADICVFRGTDDTIFTSGQFARLRECLTRAAFIDIDDAPHSVLLTHPEKIAPLITRFLDSSAPPSMLPDVAPASVTRIPAAQLAAQH